MYSIGTKFKRGDGEMGFDGSIVMVVVGIKDMTVTGIKDGRYNICASYLNDDDGTFYREDVEVSFDFYTFEAWMTGKEGWVLIHNPSCLPDSLFEA